MDYPTISVIIPTWNSKHTLAATIQSCLDQTVSPLEILVCDDGSTDNSKELVEEFQHEKVTWIAGEHSGTPALPRNRGMLIARGEWIAFCDSDDIWLPTKLERQLLLVAKTNCKAACTNALIKVDDVVTTRMVSNWQKEIITFKNLLKNNDVVCSSAIIHSSIFKAVGGFTEIVEHGAFADYIYWLRVATKTNFAFIVEPLVVYDDHALTSMRGNAPLSDEVIQKRTFNDFAKHDHPFIFMTMVKMRQIELTVKKIVKNSIKYLYKND